MLTRKQKEILDFIKMYSKKHGYAPSILEMAKRFKRAVGTIHEHIQKLKEGGYLRKEENKRRGIEVSQTESMIKIPFLGTIAAGQPIESIEMPETITVQKSLLSKSGEHYALRVQGNSMIDEGIFDGDNVIIRKQPTAENGETVVALIHNNEVTLKKIYREKNGFRLQPANPSIKPIFAREVIVQGKVISIIRNFEELKEKITSNKNKEFTEATINYIKETNINYRKSLGQYFTPKSIREALLEKLPKTIKNPKILDPACGTGEFLITAREFFSKPELHGWEIDRKLIDISKKLIPEAKIEFTDSLKQSDEEKYDFVIGNPPYFEFKPDKEMREKYDCILNGRPNIYGIFIFKGIKQLKEGGYLAYIVPPSMNNGAYFAKLREFIVNNCNIEFLSVQKTPTLFDGALQSVMLLVLRKGRNKGDYTFRKNGILIFNEKISQLKKEFKNSLTLHDLGYEVRTGKLVWNQNKNILTNNSKKDAIPLIWSHNITENGLKLNNNKKPQYARIRNHNEGPAIVVNRIVGQPGKGYLKAALIPEEMKFIAENHVNVIYPSKQSELYSSKKKKISLEKLIRQLNDPQRIKLVQIITGNTQISKNELEKLFPIKI